MDTENCTNLYLQVCQTFLTSDPDKVSSYEDLYRLLPWLRQSLTCCVCADVAVKPMSSTNSHCQHFICSKCKGGKMILRPQCSWCKDPDAFQPNSHLEILVACFVQICLLIFHSPLYEHIKDYEKLKGNINQEKFNKLEHLSPTKKKRSKRSALSSNLLTISAAQVLEDSIKLPHVKT